MQWGAFTCFIHEAAKFERAENNRDVCPLSLRGEKVTSFISHQERGFKVTVHPKMYSP